MTVAQKSMLVNAVKNGFSAFSSLALFVLLVIAGRKLGASDFGIFSFALALTFLLEPIMDPGLYHLLIREIARNPRDASQYISNVLSYKLTSSILFFACLYVTVILLDKDKIIVEVVLILGISALLKSVKDAFRTVLLAYENFGLEAVSITLERIALLGTGIWALASGKGLFGLCWVFVIIRLLDIVLVYFLVMHTAGTIGFGRSLSLIRNLLIKAVPIGGFYIALNVYNYVDTVMLSAMRSNAEVGWYNASYRLYEGLVILPSIIGTVFMPRLAWSFVNDSTAFSKLIFRGLKYLVVLSMVASANGLMLSNTIIIKLFGMNYAKAVDSLNILLTGVFFVFIINFLQTVMITMDRQKVILVTAICGLCLNVALNMVCIRLYGYIGAAAVTVSVEACLMIVLVVVLARRLDRIPWQEILAKPTFCILVPFFAVYTLLPSHMIILRVFVLNVGILVLIFYNGVFSFDELKWIPAMFRIGNTSMGE